MSKRQDGGSTDFAIPDPIVKYNSSDVGRVSSKDFSKSGHGHRGSDQNQPPRKHKHHTQRISSFSITIILIFTSYMEIRALFNKFLGKEKESLRSGENVTGSPVPVAVPRPSTSFGRCTHLETFKRSPQMASYLKVHTTFVFPTTTKQFRLKVSLYTVFFCIMFL